MRKSRERAPHAAGDPPLDPAQVESAEAFLAFFRVPADRDYFTPKLLAKWLPRSARAWQQDCRRGLLAAQHVGREWIILRPALIAYLAVRSNGVSRMTDRGSRA